MWRVVFPVVAAVLCLRQVNSLLCYTCDGPTPSSECTTESNCTAEAARYIWCKTIVYSGESGFPFQGNESVIRMCAAICEESYSEDLGVPNPIFCCDTDFCNNRGVDSGTECIGSCMFITASMALVCVLSKIKL